jgi:AcrR family transcriptional regulator
LTSAETRKRFLDAATEILANDPLSHFTIDYISERAGKSRRTFFLHFGSKDDLLKNVLENTRAFHQKTMRDWSNNLDEASTVEARITLIFRRIIDTINDPRWKGSAFTRLSGELSDLEEHPLHAVVVAAKIDQEIWFQSELERGNYTSPPLLAEQLVVILTGLLQLQVVHRSPRHGLAVLDMLPSILRAGEIQSRRSLTG